MQEKQQWIYTGDHVYMNNNRQMCFPYFPTSQHLYTMIYDIYKHSHLFLTEFLTPHHYWLVAESVVLRRNVEFSHQNPVGSSLSPGCLWPHNSCSLILLFPFFLKVSNITNVSRMVIKLYNTISLINSIWGLYWLLTIKYSLFVWLLTYLALKPITCFVE